MPYYTEFVRAAVATFVHLADCHIVDSTYPLTVALVGSGRGIVASEPPGIACGDTCSAVFDHGTAVNLTAEADADSVFSGWGGEGCSGTGVCQLAMVQARNVTAVFHDANSQTGDVNSDGNVDVLDIFYLINHLFAAGPPPM